MALDAPDTNLPYLQPGDPASAIPVVGEALAKGICERVTLPLIAAAGWSITAQSCWAFLGDVALWWDVSITRTGADIGPTPSTGGNIGDVDVLTVNDTALAPLRAHVLLAPRGTLGTWSATYLTDRRIIIGSGPAGATWPSGGTGYLQGPVLLK